MASVTGMLEGREEYQEKKDLLNSIKKLNEDLLKVRKSEAQLKLRVNELIDKCNAAEASEKAGLRSAAPGDGLKTKSTRNLLINIESRARQFTQANNIDPDQIKREVRASLFPNFNIDQGKNGFSEDAMLSMIKNEIVEKQESSSKQFKEVMEKMQEAITQLENERDDLEDRVDSLENERNNQQDMFKQLREKYMESKHEYDCLLIDFDALNSKSKESEELANQLKSKNIDIEKTLRLKANRENNDNESKIKELTAQLTEASKERDGLRIKLTDVLSSKNMNDEIRDMQQDQLKDIMQKYSQTSEENEKIKRRMEMLIEDYKSATDNLEAREKEIIEMQERYQIEIKMLQAQHENRLKQCEIEVAARARVNTTSPDDFRNMVMGTGLSPLEMDEHDYRGSTLMPMMARGSTMLPPMIRATFKPSMMHIPPSNRNIMDFGDGFTKKFDNVNDDLEYLVL